MITEDSAVIMAHLGLLSSYSWLLPDLEVSNDIISLISLPWGNGFNAYPGMVVYYSSRAKLDACLSQVKPCISRSPWTQVAHGRVH